MKKTVAVIFSIFFVFASFALAMAADQDVAGGRDYPLLSRMPNFHIAEYREKDYEGHKFVGKEGKKRSFEGHYYYIRYILDNGADKPGALKIIRHIQDALKKIGGQVTSDRSMSSTIMIQKDRKETWVEVKAYPAEYVLTIVERGEIKQDAAAMESEITTSGHVPVYGIYFDAGKSEIKPESDAAISEIAKLLKNNGTLKVYIVSHTDNAGPFDSNMKLSKDRADAVAKVLTSKYGIAATRLASHGAASFAPVATNDTEEGRAKNRRVELVKQ